LAHRDPLCWHRPLPRQKPKEQTLSGPAETLSSGRNHLGTASDIKSEWWARSSRNPGRLPSESAVFRKEGLVDELKKALSERILNAEIDEHLGGEGDEGKGNHRNGYSKKSVLTGTSK
jgi:hypothetical protein